MRISDWSSDVCSSDLYPAALAGFMGLLLASRRLYVMFIGGGQHQASNDARTSMYQDGIPLILSNPWGFGANQAAAALNYRLPSGMPTIASHYLRSEDRRVGKGCVSTCTSRWSPYP